MKTFPAPMYLGYVVLLAMPLAAQDATTPTDPPVDKRAYGILPNYRTANLSDPFVPLTTRRKFYIASKDSFDYPIFITGAVFAGLAQWKNQHPSFGQGTKGFAHRYVTAFADQSIGNYLTEGAVPALLHQDPRYFRLGSEGGGVMKRTAYSVTRLFVAKTDHGHWTFNFGEVVGNAAAAGIANAYYPGERSLPDNYHRLFTALATDGISQLLKEFWPDVKRKLKRHSNP